MWNTKKEDFLSSTVLEFQTQTKLARGEMEEDLSTELLGTTTLRQLRGETGLERSEERNLQTEFYVTTLELQPSVTLTVTLHPFSSLPTTCQGAHLWQGQMAAHSGLGRSRALRTSTTSSRRRTSCTKTWSHLC